ncbi:MAG: thioredoxin reductase [Clostridia bacterium]|jgi:thioredoxin reductase (NADPH)|nr:thioredoxin reductase [Clostridia bacterium]MDN5322597.1 thioredoxin reductase [Clostridia bacterium]
MLDVVIIGGGPAGMTAGIYAARAGFKTMILETGAPGGQASTTETIENYPGFPGGISGPELMMKFYEQTINFGVEMEFAHVESLELTGPVKKVKAGDNIYETRSVIIASGARPRVLGVQGEAKFRGKGVSYCATCDGFFFKDKEVAVIGGGDTAVEEALYLTKICSKVYLIHRRDKLRATQILQDRAMKNEKIEFIWDTVVDEITGDDKLNGLSLHNVKTQKKFKLNIDGVFIFVGYIPNSDYLPREVEIDERGYVITDVELRTNVAGVYAIGDVRQKNLRQVATAVGDGALAITTLERDFAK